MNPYVYLASHTTLRGTIFTIVVIGLLIACPFSIGGDKSWVAPKSISGATTVNASGIFELVDKYDDLVVIDSRKTADFNQGHIEDSINLPDTKTSRESLAGILQSTDTAVVFYCNGIHCKRSSSAIKIAVSAGYTNIFWYRLGWDEWLSEGLPFSHNE